MWPAPTLEETSLGEMPEDFDISSYQASRHHIQAASFTPYLHFVDKSTSIWHRTFQTLTSSSFRSSPTWNARDSLWGHFKPPVLLHPAHSLVVPPPVSSAWGTGAIPAPHCPVHRTDERKWEGLMLCKTRSREWAEGIPSWRHCKEVLRGPEWLILDHTMLTTSKEESEADALYLFLPCLWSSVSKSLLYLS